jgi:hypothetical protein
MHFSESNYRYPGSAFDSMVKIPCAPGSRSRFQGGGGSEAVWLGPSRYEVVFVDLQQLADSGAVKAAAAGRFNRRDIALVLG